MALSNEKICELATNLVNKYFRENGTNGYIYFRFSVGERAMRILKKREDSSHILPQGVFMQSYIDERVRCDSENKGVPNIGDISHVDASHTGITMGQMNALNRGKYIVPGGNETRH